MRRGLLAALGSGADIVGYYDADLATPPAEMARLVAMLRDSPEVAVVLGSRVALLGSRIERSLPRHYLGRVFATASSVVLGMTVLRHPVRRQGVPGHTGARAPRWPHRSTAAGPSMSSCWGACRGGDATTPGLPTASFVEVPLSEWHDRGGSKLGPVAAVRAGLDLARVRMALKKR